MDQHRCSVFEAPAISESEHISSDSFPTVSLMKSITDHGGLQQEPKIARIRDVENPLSPAIRAVGRSWKKPVIRVPGWRGVVVISFIFMILTLVSNIVILIWSFTRPSGSFGGSRLLFKGNCDRTASIDTWVHVGINILSTFILAGGNYASQLLVAPTRDAIDRAHSQGRSLDIGLPGLKNWSFIGLRHRFLLSILLLSTIPMHVVYNSTVFSTISSINIWSLVVTNDYLVVPQQYSSLLSTGNLPPLSSISHIAGDDLSFVNLTASECSETFSANVIHDYSGYLKVLNISSWAYHGSILAYYENISTSRTEEPQPQPWTLLLPGTFDIIAEVQYCLGVKNEPICTVELVPTLLNVIVVCNVIKAAVLMAVLYLPINPLRTIGDVVASFMESPDTFTRGLGAVSALDFLSSKPYRFKNRRWKSLPRRYFHGASRRRWLSTILFGAIFWLIGFTLGEITLGTQPEVSLSKQWRDGFGSLQPNFESPLSFDLISGIIVANLPQLYLSFIYVFFNALATSILLSKEWIGYSFERKGLRVTNPIGEQRSTYFLSLPYRYSVPLAAISIVLHWLLSQTIFVAAVNQYATDIETGEFRFDGLSYTVAYSNLSLAVLLGVSGILIIGMMLFGCFKYKLGIPIVQGDSRAISAACHPIRGHGDPTKKIQYGVIARLGQGRYHVGFSSGPVKPLTDGQYYQ